MKIEYLGTAAAEGFPAVFCNCCHCLKARQNLSEELRTRSQLLVDGDLLIDFPADSYWHAMQYGLDFSAVKYLLVTHSHTDHFYAQEFVNRGYKFAFGMREASLSVFGNAEVASVYEEGVRREIRDSVRGSISFTVIEPFSDFSVGDYHVLSLPARHGNKERALLFCISKKGKTLLYLNDTGPLHDEIYPFLVKKGVCADFVSLDCTFADDETPSSDRHMNFAQNMEVRKKLEENHLVKADTKYCVTHFSHNSAPFRARMEALAEKFGFYAAHDGLAFEI